MFVYFAMKLMNCLLLALFSGMCAEINILHNPCETVMSYLMSML